MDARTQIALSPDLQRRAHEKAAALGISFAEYVRRVIARDLQEPERPPFDITRMFDLGSSPEPTDVARDKDSMLGEAAWEEHMRKTGAARKKKRRP